MLVDYNGKPIENRNIHPEMYRKYEKALAPHINSIMEFLEQVFDDSDKHLNSTYKAPKNWTNTPLQPIYDVIGDIGDDRLREDQAALLYGILVWHAGFDHGDKWCPYRPERDDGLIIGMTYFRYNA